MPGVRVVTRTYLARGPHKRTCDLCDQPILPGDQVVTWAWVAEEIQDSNIMRVHETCHLIYERESMEDFTRGQAFEDSPLEQEAMVNLVTSRFFRAQTAVLEITDALAAEFRGSLLRTLRTRYHACGSSDPDCPCGRTE